MSKVNRAEKQIARLDQRISKIVSIRWFIFFVGVGLLIAFWENYQHALFYLLSFIIISFFIASSLIHASSERTLSKWKHYLDLLKIELSRQELNWEALPSYRARELSHEDFDLITATDLHLIGPHSVLHLMDSCISNFGQKTLIDCLLKDETIQQIKLRQNKIKELLPLSIFRMKFKLLGKLHSNELINREGLFSIFSMQIFQKKFFLIFTLLILVQVINAGLIVGTILGEIKPYFLLMTLIIFLLYQLLKNRSENAFEVGLSLQLSLERLVPIFQMMENVPVKKDDALYEEFSAFRDNPPSALLKKVNLVVSLLSVRANPLLKLILNYLLPWDFGLLVILESLKVKHYPHLQKWMNSLGKLEALVSLADYSHNTGGLFPTFLEPENAIYLEAYKLDHPLMSKDKRISNSYIIEKNSPIAVITGSNMAGKSTFLRTIGINIVLARAGVTVLSEKFVLQNLSVKSLIKAQDFLEKEMSLFYFEVKRLKEILLGGRQSSAEVPFLFLVDEIYRGTNNQERYQGAVAYLKEFSSVPHCCGLLTTHDINIAKDLEQNSAIRQYHFKEMFKDGALYYDYKINQGICETTNALRIMEKEGLPT